MSAADDHKAASTFFKDFLGLDGDELDRFVNSAMKKRGHKPTVAWLDAEPDDSGNDATDIFGARKKKEPTDDGKKKNDGGWMYGS